MAAILKVDQILSSNGSKFDGSQLANVGKVLQMHAWEDHNYSSTTSSTWSTIHTITVNNISAGSKIIIEASISHLIESSGSGGFRIIKASDLAVVGRATQHGTNGNGGWREILPTLMVEDTNPSVGTNVYNIQFASTGCTIYYNYWSTVNFGASSYYKVTEIGA